MRSCFEVLFVDVFVYFLCLLLTPIDETFICGRVLWIRGEFGRGRFRWISVDGPSVRSLSIWASCVSWSGSGVGFGRFDARYSVRDLHLGLGAAWWILGGFQLTGGGSSYSCEEFYPSFLKSILGPLLAHF